MPAHARPISPHLSIYRWQIQMVTSILHRATGVALAVGTILLVCGLLSLATGPEAWARFRDFCASPLGMILLFGWSWALAFHLLNGLRHLWQDAGYGFAPATFVRNGWIATLGSLVLVALIWGMAWAGKGGI